MHGEQCMEFIQFFIVTNPVNHMTWPQSWQYSEKWHFATSILIRSFMRIANTYSSVRLRHNNVEGTKDSRLWCHHRCPVHRLYLTKPRNIFLVQSTLYIVQSILHPFHSYFHAFENFEVKVTLHSIYLQDYYFYHSPISFQLQTGRPGILSPLAPCWGGHCLWTIVIQLQPA